MADNIVLREKYNGLVEVNGQLLPRRGEVLPDEIVQTQPEDEVARNNGGGVENKRRRRNFKSGE